MAPGTGVSLVIPVKDEAGSIAALIRSIRQQVRQPDEVILVDGGSTDGTVDAVRRLIEGDVRFRLIDAGAATPGRGRNLGIEAATHPWIALTDAGIALDPHWLERLVRPVEHDAGIGVVYGSFRTAGKSLFERCADLAYIPPLTPSPRGPLRPRFVASSLVRKDVWLAAGRFPDLRAAEDRVFMGNVDALPTRVAAAPEALLTWQLQPTAALTFRRFRHYSMHNVLAGQQRHWHHGIARLYLTGLGLAAAARAVGRSPLPLLAAAGSLRVGRTLWRRREGRGIAWMLRPDRFVTVAAILVIVDAGTFVGWVDAVLARRRGA